MDAARTEKLEATTRWDPAEAEARIFARWEESGAFEPGDDPDAESFSIAIPPPNVTGALHMGHALNGTVQDALTRLARMQGKNALWILGTDHAGIGTQMVVEKQLRAAGTSRARARPREVRRPGLGVAGRVRLADRRAVQASRRLLRLRARALHPRRGLRQRRSTASSRRSTRRAGSTATTTWSTGTRARARRSPTSRSSTRRSPTPSTRSTTRSRTRTRCITVATVRPETMLADTAVAVNPDDERYQRFIGRHVCSAAGRPPAAGDRRRARRRRVRHRRAQDHPGPRPERLRDRPQARARGDRRDRRGRADDRRRPGGSPG